MIGLRVNNKFNQSYQGFQYPTSGEVEAPDWDPEPVCGQGLHFFKDGEGDGNLVYEQAQDPESIWQIVEADDSRAVDLDSKWKVPRLKILKSGKRDEILKELRVMVGPMKKIMYTSEFAGDRGTVLVGDYGTARAGDYGSAWAGSFGTARAGYSGTAQAGNYGTAQAGYRGTAQAGYSGKAQVGSWGTAIVEQLGMAVAGDYGIASAWFDGVASAGIGGTILFRRADGSTAHFPVDGERVKANQPYSFVDNQLVELTQAESAESSGSFDE